MFRNLNHTQHCRGKKEKEKNAYCKNFVNKLKLSIAGKQILQNV